MEMIKKFLRIVFHIDNFFVSVFTVALLCLLLTVIKKLDFLDPVEKVLDLSMIDLYYQINNTGEKTINQQISIVDITQLTERQRDSMAIVVNQIAEMNPAVLGVDIIFERQLANSKADSDLMIAFFEASQTIPIVMAEKLSSSNWESSNYTYITHSFFSEEVGLEEGSVNVTAKPSEGLETYPVYLTMGTDTVYSFPAKIVEVLTGNKVIPNKGREHTINYDAVTFNIIDYHDLPQSRDLIEGRCVLLGASKEERDKHLTPIGEMAGIEVLAHTINSMTYGNHVWYGGLVWVIIVAILAGFLMNGFEFLTTKFIRKVVPSYLNRILKKINVQPKEYLLLDFFTESEIYDKIVAFIFMIVFTLFTYWLYKNQAIYVNTWLALGTIAFIEEGRLIYRAGLTFLYKKGVKKPVLQSLYKEEVLDSIKNKKNNS